MRNVANTCTVGLGLAALLVAVATAPAAAQKAAPPRVAAPVDRTTLPIAPPQYPPLTELDARKATPPPRFEIRPPRGAPNVVIVLIDDMGFGQPSTFGGGASPRRRWTGWRRAGCATTSCTQPLHRSDPQGHDPGEVRCPSSWLSLCWG